MSGTARPLFRAPNTEGAVYDAEIQDARNPPSQVAPQSALDDIEVVSESEEEEEEEEEGVTSIPVYLSRSSSYGSKQTLCLFQYPNYPAGAGVPMPPSAAERNLSLAARWRPRANWVEVDVPLDTRPRVYNTEAGQAMGANIAPPAAASKKSRVKSEHLSDDEDSFFMGASSGRPRGSKLDKIRLQSSQVPNATRYFVGVMHDGKQDF